MVFLGEKEAVDISPSTFRELKIGDIFRFYNDFYMKVEPTTNEDGYEKNALFIGHYLGDEVSLNGAYISFDNENVYPVNCTMFFSADAQ